jgi:hypothetical protein
MFTSFLFLNVANYNYSLHGDVSVIVYEVILINRHIVILNYTELLRSWRHAVAQWLRHCATNRKVAGSIPDGVIGIFHWHKPFRPHYGPEVDSASNRNEYQEYFLGVKAAGAYGWQSRHLHVPTVLKSGTLNLQEPSGPVKACNGIDLLRSYSNRIPAMFALILIPLFYLLFSKTISIQINLTIK